MEQETKPFIKFIRKSDRYFWLIKKRPSAFVLLSLVANRARRTDEEGLKVKLDIAEALVGDHDSYKATESVYRTDIKFLIRHGFILKTKTSRRGTVVKLIDTDIFDICPKLFNQEIPTNKRIHNTGEINNTSSNNTQDLTPPSFITPEINNTEVGQ